MKTLFAYLLAYVFCIGSAYSQTIKVQPYLQDATPNSIYILWETDEGEESIVEWGLDENLGNSTEGDFISTVGTAKVHEVKLEDLERFTTYFYRVKTDNAISEIFQFKTPPFSSDSQSFRLLAMSDMQRDGNHPDKFREVVEDGVINFIEEEFGGAIIDNLALVMIPGDLVTTGTTYSQWENHFFRPSQNLFNQVPVYPVPGNHENDAVYFFQYFHLPENGTPGFEEHWWYKDYGNVRIIGLDSNSPYTNLQQLGWLDETLNATCDLDSIDFVFAQLHHPFKSELWTPGEKDYTGDVINLLENFSSTCGKPSIHFFGHTHGYSRGQSRDHKHLWVNVATAGGAIDNWGEFPQFDYDEFSVSRDEWGFVMVEVEVEDGEAPQFTLKRISRGNETIFRDNEIVDSLTISRMNTSIIAPTPLFPINGQIVRPECIVFKASPFEPNSEEIEHGQSHWQVSKTCDNFILPEKESWKNFENLYFDEDTQAGDDLADEKIIGLEENTDYCWRVRYRDKSLNWSAWSEPANFKTGISVLPANLLINPGAEADLLGWTTEAGVLEALEDGECNGISPYSGSQYFAVGGVCEDGAFGQAYQDVNVVAFSDSIDAGTFEANFGGYLSNWGGSDLPELRVVFLDDFGEKLDSSGLASTLNNTWTIFDEWAQIPAQTRIIRFELFGTRNAGNDNDSYFDDLFLRVGRQDDGCDEFVTSTHFKPINDIILQVVPNPVIDKGRIEFTEIDLKLSHWTIRNIMGQEMNSNGITEQTRLVFDSRNLSAGVYFLELIFGNGVYKSQIKFVVEK